MAAASSYAWPSVVVYTEATLVKTRTIVKCDWSDNFGALLERLGDAFDNETVLKEAISNEKLINPTHVVPLDAPVRLLQTYDCHYDSYYLAASIAASEEAQTQQQRNALVILMQNAGRPVLPQAAVVNVTSSGSEQQLRGDQRLRNDFLQYLHEKKVGWSPGVVSSTGERFVRTLSSALWYLDPHHQQLMER